MRNPKADQTHQQHQHTTALVTIQPPEKPLSSCNSEKIRQRTLDFLLILFGSLQGTSMDFKHRMMLNSAQGILIPMVERIDPGSLQQWLERSNETLTIVLDKDCSDSEYETRIEPIIREIQDALANAEDSR